MTKDKNNPAQPNQQQKCGFPGGTLRPLVFCELEKDHASKYHESNGYLWYPPNQTETSSKTWLACGSERCGKDDCLDCWPMNRANFGPNDVIAAPPADKPTFAHELSEFITQNNEKHKFEDSEIEALINQFMADNHYSVHQKKESNG